MAFKQNAARRRRVRRGYGRDHHQRPAGGRGDPGGGPGPSGLRAGGVSLGPGQRDGGAGGERRPRRRGAMRGRGPAPGGAQGD